MEKIIQTKTCKHCQTPFDITNRDMEFYDKISPMFGGKKFLVPTPQLCPDCRSQRRLSFRNERKLYKRKCDLTGKDLGPAKDIISIYSPATPYKVYEHKAWRSDQRDPLDYGQELDLAKSFFQQRAELYQKVPKNMLNGHDSNENSPYTNYTVWTKNGYFNFGWWYNEDCYYTTLLMHSQNCMDSHFTIESQQCYEVNYCNKCYNIHFSNHCEECRDSYFLEDCNGCQSCFACSHLNNAEYHIFNLPVSKEIYGETIQRFLQWDNELKQQVDDFFARIPHNQRYITRGEACIGHNIKDGKHCNLCFNVQGGEDLKYCNVTMGGITDCYDIDQSGLNCNLSYEFMTASMNIYHIMFCFVIRENSQYLIYCGDTSNCTNCFGCVGLKNKSYCILNKQYTKEEYEILVPQLIEKMNADWERWEYFPSHISPFWYNETVAIEHFPLTKEEALQQGFNRSDYETPFPKVEKILKANELPSIQEVTDDILNQAIECEVTKKPFRIIKQELAFYRKHNLPLPRRHPDQRHLDRMAKYNPRKLRNRKCNKCWIDMKTSYTPERKEIVYCEDCYNKEIYW